MWNKRFGIENESLRMKTGKSPYAMSAKNVTLVLDIFNEHQCFEIRLLCQDASLSCTDV